MADTSSPLPIDWDEWRSQWQAWVNAHPTLRPFNRHHHGMNPFAGPKNFLADEVLGVFVTPAGRRVELSEVTFPDLSKPSWLGEKRRYVGITWDGIGGRDTGLAESWAELADLLGVKEG